MIECLDQIRLSREGAQEPGQGSRPAA